MRGRLGLCRKLILGASFSSNTLCAALGGGSHTLQPLVVSLNSASGLEQVPGTQSWSASQRGGQIGQKK